MLGGTRDFHIAKKNFFIANVSAYPQQPKPLFFSNVFKLEIVIAFK